MTVIGVVGEDENHFRVATALIDGALVTSIDWVRDILESCREWRGLRAGERWYKYAPDDAHDLRPVTIDGMTIKLQGRIAGEPLKPEAGMWRKVLLLLCHAEPRPDLVVLARDLDGYPDRRSGIEQVCHHLPWPFPDRDRRSRAGDRGLDRVRLRAEQRRRACQARTVARGAVLRSDAPFASADLPPQQRPDRCQARAVEAMRRRSRPRGHMPRPGGLALARNTQRSPGVPGPSETACAAGVRPPD